MGFGHICGVTQRVTASVVKKTDNVAGKVLTKIGKVLVGTPKIPDDLAAKLNDVGVNVSGKNARRTVEAAIKNQLLINKDFKAGMIYKLVTSDPEPGMLDCAEDALQCLKDMGAKNTSLAKAADNSRNMLSFRHENLSQSAKDVIAKYTQSPLNAAKLYFS